MRRVVRFGARGPSCCIAKRRTDLGAIRLPAFVELPGGFANLSAFRGTPVGRCHRKVDVLRSLRDPNLSCDCIAVTKLVAVRITRQRHSISATAALNGSRTSGSVSWNPNFELVRRAGSTQGSISACHSTDPSE